MYRRLHGNLDTLAMDIRLFSGHISCQHGRIKEASDGHPGKTLGPGLQGPSRPHCIDAVEVEQTYR